MKKSLSFPVAIVMVVVAIVGLLVWGNSKKQEPTSREIALSCTTDMATQYHIHPELKIVVNGAEVLVPKNLGIKPTCMTAIHTHEEKNILHIESPIQKEFTLGDFFAVWGKDFSSSKLLDNVVDSKSEIIVTVNGEKVETYENTILNDKDKIVIEFKSKPDESNRASSVGSVIKYQNDQYGFSLTLPGDWKDYSIITSKWNGYIMTNSQGEAMIEQGPQISIRNPLWSEQNHYQDIPVMVYTLDQWNELIQGKFSVGPAPINPQEVGRNSRYVFAIPARYNYAFPNGFQEVDKIIGNKSNWKFF